MAGGRESKFAFRLFRAARRPRKKLEMPAPAKPPSTGNRQLARMFKKVIALKANVSVREMRIAHPTRTMILFGIPFFRYSVIFK
jgi:hypothetical protein